MIDKKEKEKTESRHYIFLVFLILLNVMNFVDRQLLASFANFIIPDLSLSNTQFGILTGFGFLFFYSIMGLFMGILADKVHRPRLIAIGVALWSFLTALSGAAKGFTGLLLPRMFIGVGESILTPTSISILGDRFPQSKMGFVTGAYYMGIPIGAGLSLIIAGSLGPIIGWRMCFYILGGLGVILSLIMFFIKETPRSIKINNSEKKKIDLRLIKNDLIKALKDSKPLTLCIYGGVIYHFVLGAAVYDQVWYVKERGFDKAEIAQYTGYIVVVFGILGNLFGGLGSDWFSKKFNLGRPMFLFWVMLLLLPLNILGRIVSPDTYIFWIAMMAGSFQLGAVYGPIFATVQELAPSHMKATVIAFFILNLNMIGMFIGTTGTGIILDTLIMYNENALVPISEPYTKTLLFFTLISSLSIPMFWFAGKK
ncbi:MFS transporter [Hyphomicrobiales bacterium]|jgi:MFS family permease|nr:MFS transporter [Hyphomicrobiales bacterium]|tara:strand:+ start:1032 stop:2306 length:1275 start_codon:yes stop_codon:yes gene_type:complete